MSENVQDIVMGESMRTLGGLRITSLDDSDNDDLEEQQGDLGEEYDDSSDNEEQEPVVLGFVEEAEHSWSLLRQLFPNKAGGTPAWLDPVNLPSGNSCLCDLCGDPLQFVLQVYAPLDDKESTFHRTIFVFMCLSMTCLLRDQHEQWKRTEKASRCVKVFRCQLPRSNPFYSSVPPNRDGHDKPSGPGAALCSWCGTWKGDQVCGSCKRGCYCSRKHQAMHWRLGHKIECQQLRDLSVSFDSGTESKVAQIQKVASNNLWPEYEIINEDESNYVDTSEDGGCATSLVSKREDDSLNSLFDSIQGDVHKKNWVAFEERIANAPEQILRYSPRGVNTRPLWPLSSGRPSNADIGNCGYCGGPRRFEFQILPQLLYYFHVKNEQDSLDWATIAIYTCEASCEANVAYKEEFAWVQLYS